MKNLAVCISPYLLPLYELENKIVVVADILRATSCIVTGIASGVDTIIPFESVEDCLKMGEKGFLRAGERNSVLIQGFEIGNSPFEYMDKKGKKIALTTTNGTQAIHKSLKAEKILIGAFLNISLIVRYLKNQPHDVLLVCAGRKNFPNLEDTLFAGAVASMLQQDFEIKDDSARLAREIYEKNQENLLDFVQEATHYQRLFHLGEQRDLEFCFRFDEYEVLPIYQNGEIR